MPAPSTVTFRGGGLVEAFLRRKIKVPVGPTRAGPLQNWHNGRRAIVAIPINVSNETIQLQSEIRNRHDDWIWGSNRV